MDGENVQVQSTSHDVVHLEFCLLLQPPIGPALVVPFALFCVQKSFEVE